MLDIKKLLTKTLEKFNVSEVVFKSSDYTYLSSNAIVRKQGSIVHLYISTLTGLPNVETVTLFTLPEGYRPAGTINCDLFHSGSSIGAMVRITVNANGTVTAYNYSASTGTINCRGNLTFIT